MDDGTQLPYIKTAKELGFAVIVFNTNEKGPRGGDPVKHAMKAWDQFVLKVNSGRRVGSSFLLAPAQ